MYNDDDTLRIANVPEKELEEYYNLFKKTAINSNNGKPSLIKYINLGTQIIKIENYSPEMDYYINTYLDYSLQNNADKYNATIIIWKDNNLQNLFSNKKIKQLTIHEFANKISPIIQINTKNNTLEAFDKNTNTYYISRQDMSPDAIAKLGHLFVHPINKITKTPTTSLVHGAAVGINGKGVLICARGGKGKSTLTVSTILDNFEYVSDDYLILENNNGLYARPIYSIITLSPKMHNELKDLNAEFISNNWNKSKYILNISNHHKSFTKKLEIKAVLFPNIIEDIKKPTIEAAEKGKAITQMIHSTIIQMGDNKDIQQIQKLMSFLKNLNFYQINLSQNLKENVKELRKFIELL